jgi:alkylation response protein AidB-like acyl-CoA dehydrogenase
MDLLQHLVASPAAPENPAPLTSSLVGWIDRLGDCPFEASIDRAAWAGFESDRLGYAFAGGYDAALRRLIPGARRASLAATEKGGAHPRAIETRLDPASMTLHGTKTFVTLAGTAEELFVVASKGTTPDGRNALVLVRVKTNASGVTIEHRPPTPFAPEIPHAIVRFDGAIVSPEDVLPGDGYDVYLKPFRTIEDAHVLAATCGLVVRTARAHGLGGGIAERGLAFACALRSIGDASPSRPEVHLALAGLFLEVRELLEASDREWDKVAGESATAAWRERWKRDLGLLLVAETVRQKRTEAAQVAVGWKR